ncbi:MAG: hypothetical protein ABI330_16955 [Caldimonas sp.]
METRLIREALFAQLHADLDDLLGRVESLPEKVSKLETSLQVTTTALIAGGDKYRAAVTALNEEAKTNLTQYMRLEAGKVTTAATGELTTAMQTAATTAFRSEASDKAAALAISLAHAAKEFNRSKWARFGELVLACGLTSLTTAGLVFVLLRGAHAL